MGSTHTGPASARTLHGSEIFTFVTVLLWQTTVLLSGSRWSHYMIPPMAGVLWPVCDPRTLKHRFLPNKTQRVRMFAIRHLYRTQTKWYLQSACFANGANSWKGQNGGLLGLFHWRTWSFGYSKMHPETARSKSIFLRSSELSVPLGNASEQIPRRALCWLNGGQALPEETLPGSVSYAHQPSGMLLVLNLEWTCALWFCQATHH